MFENITQLENEVREFHKNILASQDLLKRLDSLIQAVTGEHNAVVSEAEAVNRSVLEKSQAAFQLLEASTDEVRQANRELQEQFLTQSEKICASTAKQSGAMCSAVSHTAETVTAGNQELLEQIHAQYQSVSRDTVRTLKEITEGNDHVISDIRANIAELQSALTSAGKQQLSANDQALQDTVQRIKQMLTDLLRELSLQDQSIMQNTSADIFLHLNEYAQNLQKSIQLLEQERSDLQQKYDEFVQAISSDKIQALLQKTEQLEKSVNQKFTLLFAGVGITALLVILSFFF